MQIVINSADLRTVTRRMSGVVNPDAIIEIMQCVLFQASVNKATFTGTDTQITTVTTVPCIFDQGVVQFAIPMRDLKGLADSMPSSTPVTINVEGKDVTASAGNLVLKYVVLDAALFYKIPDMGATTETPLSPELVAALIGAAEFCAPTDPIMPWKTSTLLHGKGDKAHAVASDGHIISISQGYETEGIGAIKVMLPKNGIKTLQSFGTFAGLSLILPEDRSKLLNAVFKSEDMTVYVRLIEGDYVDYEAIIPKNYSSNFTVSASEILNAVRSLAIGTGTVEKGTVILDALGTGMQLRAYNYETSKKGNTSLVLGSSDQGDIKVCFSSSLLIRCISKLSGTLTISHSGTNVRAFIVEDDTKDVMFIAMPSLLSETNS